MIFAYFPKSSALNSGPVMQAFIHGLQYHGVSCQANSLDCDAVIIWSQLWAGRMQPNRQIYQHYRDRARPVVVIDAGMIKRNHTWRIMLDGDARLAGLGHDSIRRHELGLQMRPWQHQGKQIVIALQRPDSNQWQGLPNPESWLTCIIEQIKEQSERPIIIRPHPRYPFKNASTTININIPYRVPGTYDDYDFDQCLHDAWAVINWNSSPGVISVLNGVAAFVGPSSLAAPVANLDLSYIENPATPDRNQWCNDLAWTEWTIHEIQLGIPQKYVLERINAWQNS